MTFIAMCLFSRLVSGTQRRKYRAQCTDYGSNNKDGLIVPGPSITLPPLPTYAAGVVKLVDTRDSKSLASDGVPVRVRPPVPISSNLHSCTLAEFGVNSAVLVHAVL